MSSKDGPCSVVRGGGMRGFSATTAHQQQAVRFGLGLGFASPAPAAALAAVIGSAAWDASDEPLPDMLSAPTLRSVSSLVMSIDADESLSVARSNNTNNSSSTYKNSGISGGAAKDAAVSTAMGSKMVDMLMTPLPPPPMLMDTSDQLTREQSFPPPFHPRFNRDQSFPPMDMLPPSSCSLRLGWSTVPTSSSSNNNNNKSNNNGGSMAGGGLFAGTAGGAPSLSKFQFPGTALPWDGGHDEQDAPGGQVHPGGGSGGSSLAGSGGQHDIYYNPAPSSASRPRHSSFDKLAEMIPGIPHWTTPTSPLTSSPSLSAAAPVEAGELHGGGRSISKTEPTEAFTPTSISRPAPPARGRQQHATSGTRPDKKIKKQHLRRADSPPRARWPPSTTSPPATAAAAAATKRASPSGTGKRAAEPPLSCAPAQAGGGPVDLAQQERRRAKIQRYLYKRSRRKFANSTRDASPSRSRPKAAQQRRREKGKFVKTAPDFVSVNAGQPRKGGAGVMDIKKKKNVATPPSPKPLAAAGGVGVGARGGEGGRHGGGGGGGGGGGVRSVRNGGSINVGSFGGNKQTFSSTPSSSLLPRGGGGGARLPPPVPALAPSDGAPAAFLWQTDPMSMPM